MPTLRAAAALPITRPGPARRLLLIASEPATGWQSPRPEWCVFSLDRENLLCLRTCQTERSHNLL